MGGRVPLYGDRVAGVFLLMLLTACGGGGGGGSTAMPPPPPPPPPPMMEPDPTPPLDPTGRQLGSIYALTSAGRFISFERGAAAPSTRVDTTLSGAAGIEVRLADSSILVFSNTGSVTRLDPTTGALTPLGSTGPLSGTQIGFELIAAREELRVVTNTGTSMIVSGLDAPRGLFSAVKSRSLPMLPAGISEIAGTQNLVPCGDPSKLYLLNTDTDQLLLEQPNGRGGLQVIGNLGVDAESSGGFEIFQNADGSDAAVAVLRVGGITSLYDIDLRTGAATVVGAVPGLRLSERVVGVALPPKAPRPATRVGSIVAVNASGKLLSFDAGAPETLCVPPTSITGLSNGERIVDIDRRPADGRVYALTDAASIYTISTARDTFGQATSRKSLRADPADFSAPFSGPIDASFNIDFDPAIDTLVAIGRAGAELKIKVDTGLVTTDDPSLPGANPANVFAFTGNFGPSPDRSRSRVRFGLLLLDDKFNRTDIDGRGVRFTTKLASNATTSVLTTDLPSNTFAADRDQPIGGGELIGGLTSIRNEQATVYALTVNNHLLSFSHLTPSTLNTDVAIAGLQPGESAIAIDLLAEFDTLYALTDRARLYTIDTSMGQATFQVALAAAAGDDKPFTVLDGSPVDIDFNPASRQLRIVSALGQNLRADIVTGATTTDAPVNTASSRPQPAMFAGAAYTKVRYQNISLDANNPSQLMLFDLANEHLANAIRIEPSQLSVRDAGLLQEVRDFRGRLGLDIRGVLGFDVPAFDAAYAILSTSNDAAALYKIENLGFGVRQPQSLTFVGNVSLPQTSDQVMGLAGVGDGFSDPLLYAIVNGNSLISFTPNNVGQPKTPVVISGLVPNETLQSIDFRSDNTLFGLGSAGNIYSIDTGSGNAVLVGGIQGATLSGSRFEIDFNPLNDRLAVISESGQALFVDVNGVSEPARTTRYSVAATAATAYSNNAPGANASAQLFLDTATASLYSAGPPTDLTSVAGRNEVTDGSTSLLGTIDQIGLYQSFDSTAALEIAGGDGLILAALQPTGATQSVLYGINAVFAPRNTVTLGSIGPVGTPVIRSLAASVK